MSHVQSPLPQALCEVDDVKIYLDREWSGTQDALLIALINQFTLMAEGPFFCNRLFLKTEHEEFFNGGCRRIGLRAIPVDLASPVSVFEDAYRSFGDDTVLALYDDYDLDERTGLLRKIFSPFVFGAKVVKVRYTGGLVTEGDPGTVPPDLRGAAAMQVAAWFKNRTDPAVTDIAQPFGGMVRFQNPNDMLPQVKQTLRQYRRFDY